MPKIFDSLHPIIVSLRRKIDTEANWLAFRNIVESDTERVCKELSTRWLVAVADTYIDLGNPVEQRNAMLITMLVNMEKIGQSFLQWRVNYEDPFVVPAEFEPRKTKLWDGMTSMHLDIGDVSNNLFRRLHSLLAETPHLNRIFNVVLNRMQNSKTILAALNVRHRHVFEPDINWRDAPEYDRWRDSGHLPKK